MLPLRRAQFFLSISQSLEHFSIIATYLLLTIWLQLLIYFIHTQIVFFFPETASKIRKLVNTAFKSRKRSEISPYELILWKQVLKSACRRFAANLAKPAVVELKQVKMDCDKNLLKKFRRSRGDNSSILAGLQLAE